MEASRCTRLRPWPGLSGGAALGGGGGANSRRKKHTGRSAGRTTLAADCAEQSFLGRTHRRVRARLSRFWRARRVAEHLRSDGERTVDEPDLSERRIKRADLPLAVRRQLPPVGPPIRAVILDNSKSAYWSWQRGGLVPRRREYGLVEQQR